MPLESFVSERDLPSGVTLVPVWIWGYFPHQSCAALAAGPGQSSVPQDSACALGAQFCPQLLISWITIIPQTVSNYLQGMPLQGM